MARQSTTQAPRKGGRAATPKRGAAKTTRKTPAAKTAAEPPAKTPAKRVAKAKPAPAPAPAPAPTRAASKAEAAAPMTLAERIAQATAANPVLPPDPPKTRAQPETGRTAAKGKPGRKPAAKATGSSRSAVDEAQAADAAPARRRGRPPKNPAAETPQLPLEEAPAPRRGRPRKNTEAAAPELPLPPPPPSAPEASAPMAASPAAPPRPRGRNAGAVDPLQTTDVSPELHQARLTAYAGFIYDELAKAKMSVGNLISKTELPGAEVKQILAGEMTPRKTHQWALANAFGLEASDLATRVLEAFPDPIREPTPSTRKRRPQTPTIEKQEDGRYLISLPAAFFATEELANAITSSLREQGQM